MIREANETDILNLRVLCTQVWLHSYAKDGIRTEISNFILNTFTNDYFEQRLNKSKYKIFVYEIENHLVGCVIINLKSTFENKINGYEIDTLYVQEHFQGQGLGKEMLLKMAQNFGGTYWLSTWVYNLSAISFYKYLGFEDIGKIMFDLGTELHENRVLAVKNILDRNNNI